MYMSARMSGGAQSCGLPCATRHRHIPRLSSSNIETRPGHVLVTPSHLLSCHIRLVLIFLTYSSSPPLTAKNCVPYIFPRLGVLSTPYFQIVHFRLSKSLNWSMVASIDTPVATISTSAARNSSSSLPAEVAFPYTQT